MTDPKNLEKLDKDWRRLDENINKSNKEKRPNKNNCRDELTETLKKHAHIDENGFESRP